MRKLHILLILLIGGIGVQTFTSCSSGGGDDKDDIGREWVLDGRLVNGYDGNDAWIYLYSDGDEGFVFWDDGDFAVIEWGDGEWDFYFGTWATSGSDLRLYAGSEIFTLPYSVSGNQLTIDGDVFIKTSGINLWAGIGGGGSSSSGGGGGSSSSGGGGGVDSRLVTGSGEAWIENISNPDDGIIFKSNGEFVLIEQEEPWEYDQRGTWSMTGNTLTLSFENGKVETYTYSLSGTQLTLERNGRTDVFVKTSGIYPLGGGSSSSVSLSTAVPDEIRTQFEQSMPLHTGNTPPDISGQYLADNFTLTGSSLSGDVIGREYTDKYVAFIREANGKLSYRSKEGTLLEEGSDDVTVEIVGSNNNFTAYFIATGVSNGISIKHSTVISGTLTSNGISNFHYGFVMLEKGSDPSNLVVPEKSYRTFKDGDGLAEKYNWR